MDPQAFQNSQTTIPYKNVQPQVKSQLVSETNFFLSKLPVKPKKILAVIIGVVLGIFILLFGFKIIQGVFIRASDISPRDVVITDITENSAVIEWGTAIETQGVVEYGTTPTSLNFFAPETQKTKKHKVELTLLSPGTTYYFQIRIGEKVFDNAGVPWSFTTKAKGENKQVVIPSPSPSKGTATEAKPTLTPYQILHLGKTSSTSEKSIDCKNEIDCEKIKQNLGKYCSTRDYIKCVLKLTGTPIPTPTTSAESPTETPTPTPSTEAITETPTPTATPSPTPTPGS